MIEILDENLREQDYWINRYMPLNNLKYWYKNKMFHINFSRVEVFEDTMEGILHDIPGFKETWGTLLSFIKRVSNDGGTMEGSTCLFQFLYENNNNNSNSHKKDIKPELKMYLESLHNHFASCWYLTKQLDDGDRAMWNIYGTSGNEYGFKLSMKLNDVLDALNNVDNTFLVGKIDYMNETNKKPLFRKHNSYNYEKELRILTLDFKDLKSDYQSVLISKLFYKNITLNHMLAKEKYEEIKAILDKNTEIKVSELPFHWKLSEIKKYYTF